MTNIIDTIVAIVDRAVEAPGDHDDGMLRSQIWEALRDDGFISLNDALHTLALAHTRDDREIGFTVEYHPRPDLTCSQGDYIAAWRVVRDYVHLQTEPEGLAEALAEHPDVTECRENARLYGRSPAMPEVIALNEALQARNLAKFIYNSLGRQGDTEESPYIDDRTMEISTALSFVILDGNFDLNQLAADIIDLIKDLPPC